MNFGFINQLAKVCAPRGSYLTNDRKDEFPYRCYECELRFRFMSGLLQHAESDACRVELTDDPMRKFCEVVAKTYLT